MKGKAAPICDLVWYQVSPSTRVLQYYSELLTGKSPRLRLLWGRGGYAGFEEWSVNEPEPLFVLRRAVCVASSWVFFRFQQAYMCYPWLLAGLVDPRRSQPDKRLIAEGLMGAPEETLDIWFGQIVRERIESIDSLLSPDSMWVKALWLWSWQILCTIAQAEFQHGRNRRRAHENDAWQNFVAKSFNSEGALRLQRQHRALVQVAKSGPHHHPAQQLGPSAKAKRAKKTSPFDRYRKELIDARKAAGLKSSVASGEFWEECRKGWAEVKQDPGRLRRYENEVALCDLGQAPARPGQIPQPPELQPQPQLLDAGPQHGLLLPPIDLTGMAAAAPVCRAKVVDMQLTCPIDPARPAPFPLNPEKLMCSLHTGGSKTEPITKVHEEFIKINSGFGMFRAAITATLPRPPRWSATPAGTSKFRQSLERELQAFCLKCLPRGASSVHSAKLCLHIEVKYGGIAGVASRSQTFWAVALSGNAVAGVIPFRMNFVWCHVCAEGAEDRIILEMSRVTHVETRRELPFGGPVSVGPLAHASHSDIVARLLDTSGIVAAAPFADEVRICKRVVTPVLGDRFEVFGEAATYRHTGRHANTQAGWLAG